MDKKYGDGSNNKYSALRAAAAARQRQRSSGSGSGSSATTTTVPQPHNAVMDRRGMNHSEDAAGAGVSSSAAAVSKSDNDPYHKLQQLKQSLQKQQHQQRGQSDNAGSGIGSIVDGGTSSREIINNDATFATGHQQQQQQQQHQQTRPSLSAATATPAAAAVFPPRNSLPHSISYSDGAVMPSELGASAGTVVACSSSNSGAAAKNSNSVFATPSIQRRQLQLGASTTTSSSSSTTVGARHDSINNEVTSRKSAIVADNRTAFAPPQQPTTAAAAAQQLPSDEFFGNELASSSNVQYSDGHQHENHQKNNYDDKHVKYGYGKSEELHNSDDNNHHHHQQQQQHDRNSPPPPKTPLSMMRSVMSNIYKDRTEIEGATRQQQQQQQGSVGGGLFGTESVPMKDGNHGRDMDAAKNDELFGSDSAVAGGGVETRQYANEHHRHPPPPSDNPHNVTSVAEAGWRRDDHNINDDEIDDDMHDYGSATNHNDNWYMQRQSFPTSSSCCISYGSEIILRFRNPHILASLSVQLRGGGGGAHRKSRRSTRTWV